MSNHTTFTLVEHVDSYYCVRVIPNRDYFGFMAVTEFVYSKIILVSDIKAWEASKLSSLSLILCTK